MTFEEMLPRLKNGEKMVRTEWEGTELWIELVPATTYQGEHVNPYILIKTEDEAYSVWAPTCCDLMADDWAEVK